MTLSANTTPANLRSVKIRELLQKKQNVSIRDLAKLFSVSEMTIRRDLAKLEQGGQVKRTHGGAVPTERMAFEFDFASRRKANQKAKVAIAREAAKFVEPGQRLIIDTGTTTLELAYLIKNIENVTVITPSLAVASVLQFSDGIQTVLLGGMIRKGSPDLTGAVTEANLSMFAVDIAFQGADGVGVDGKLYSDDIRIVKVDQKIRQRANRTFVLADSSKIGRTALIAHGSVNEVEALITDENSDLRHRRAYEKMGAEIITAHI